MGHSSAIDKPIVHFSVDILSEDQLDTVEEFTLIDSLPEYQEALIEADSREGNLVFYSSQNNPVPITDDLDAMIQNICFHCITVILDERRECFLYRGMSSSGHVVIIPVGPLILIIGDEIAPIRGTQKDMLPALFQCGVRYIGLLEQLGLQDHANYLKGFANKARDSLVRHGFAI